MIPVVGKFVWGVWFAIAKRTARSYVPGPAIEDALRVCHWLSNQELASTIGFWDGPGCTPADVMQQYLAVLDTIVKEHLDSYVSIKPPSFHNDLELLAGILDRSREADIRVHFDSLGPETADESFALIEKARARHSNLGCTLPGRWTRSVHDADRAVDMGLNVRVVKGQWVDPEAPKLDVRDNFLSIIDRLAGRVPCVAIATHDVSLARECLKRLRATNARAEVELLFGLPVRPVIRVAREMGVPVRLYVPYGEAYLPYTLSQARQNPRIFFWIIRDTLLARNLLVPRSYRDEPARPAGR
jgi:proline dehydrogenase